MAILLNSRTLLTPQSWKTLLEVEFSLAYVWPRLLLASAPRWKVVSRLIVVNGMIAWEALLTKQNTSRVARRTQPMRPQGLCSHFVRSTAEAKAHGSWK